MRKLLLFLFPHLPLNIMKLPMDKNKFLFENNAKRFNINISNNYEETYKVFLANLQIIDTFNSNPANTAYKLGITPFAFFKDDQRTKYLGLSQQADDDAVPTNYEQSLFDQNAVEDEEILAMSTFQDSTPNNEKFINYLNKNIAVKSASGNPSPGRRLLELRNPLSTRLTP